MIQELLISFVSAIFGTICTLLWFKYHKSKNIEITSINPKTEITFVPKYDASSMTINELFAKVFADKAKEGAIEKAIGSKIDNLVAEVIGDLLRSYSDVGKHIKDLFKNALIPEMDQIKDFPSHHEFMLNRIKLALIKYQEEKLIPVVDEAMEEFLNEIPEKVTLTWIIKKLISDNYVQESSIMLQIEDWADLYNWQKEPNQRYSIYLDEDSSTDKREAKYKFDLCRNQDGIYKINSVSIDGDKRKNKISLAGMYGLDKILFHLEIMQGSVELDQGDDPDYYDLQAPNECHC